MPSGTLAKVAESSGYVRTTRSFMIELISYSFRTRGATRPFRISRNEPYRGGSVVSGLEGRRRLAYSVLAKQHEAPGCRTNADSVLRSLLRPRTSLLAASPRGARSWRTCGLSSGRRPRARLCWHAPGEVHPSLPAAWPARSARRASPVRCPHHAGSSRTHTRTLLARPHERARLGNISECEACPSCPPAPRDHGASYPGHLHASANTHTRARRTRSSRRGRRRRLGAGSSSDARRTHHKARGGSSSSHHVGNRRGSCLLSCYFRKPRARRRPGGGSRDRSATPRRWSRHSKPCRP